MMSQLKRLAAIALAALALGTSDASAHGASDSRCVRWARIDDRVECVASGVPDHRRERQVPKAEPIKRCKTGKPFGFIKYTWCGGGDWL